LKDTPPSAIAAGRSCADTSARYVRHSLPLRIVLTRSATFVVFASAVWSLLPLVAHQLFGLGAVGYGLLLGCLGLGAVAGAAVLPSLRRRLAVDRLMVAAAATFALSSATLAVVREPVVAGIVLLAGGGAWMATMSTINTAAWVSSSTRRRSTTSASAPAGKASRKKGRLAAVCMSATSSGECDSVVISHAPAAWCIHVPRFETSEASHSRRYSRSRSGLRAKRVGRAAVSSASAPLACGAPIEALSTIGVRGASGPARRR
jgi:Transmembrane secretion effector